MIVGLSFDSESGEISWFPRFKVPFVTVNTGRDSGGLAMSDVCYLKRGYWGDYWLECQSGFSDWSWHLLTISTSLGLFTSLTTKRQGNGEVGVKHGRYCEEPDLSSYIFPIELTWKPCGGVGLSYWLDRMSPAGPAIDELWKSILFQT